MGRNNQQRRKAKARARRQGRTPGGGAGRSFTRGHDAPDGSVSFSAAEAYRRHDDGEQILLLVHRWRRLSAEHRPEDAADAADQLLSALEYGPTRAALTRRLTDVLLDLTGDAWEHGWEPADVARIGRRRLPDSAPPVLADAIAHSLSRYAAATVSPRWHEQLRAGEMTTWWPTSSTPLTARLEECRDPEEALQTIADTLDTVDLLVQLPPLERIDAKPGTWRAPEGMRSTGTPPPDRVLEKVRRILAQAESTPYEAEAETFTAAAQSLMARHSIDLAMLAASTPGARSGEPVARRVGVDRPYEETKVRLLTGVADANRCRTVWSKELGFVTVIGFLSDIEATETLHTSLLLQATRAMTAQGSRRTHVGTSRTRSFRRSFLMAYASRIAQRLTEATQREVDAAQAGPSGTGGAPQTGSDPRTAPAARNVLAVLDARRADVDAAVEEMFPRLSFTRSRSVTDAEGWRAGTYAADHATLIGGRALADG